MVQADRLPPHQIVAEENVIASVLIDSESLEEIISSGLKTEHFYRRMHAIIFEAMLTLRRRAVPSDTSTVAAEIERRGLLEEIGGSAYLAHLIATVPTSVHAVHYASIVKSAGIKRQALRSATGIMELVYEDADVDQISQALIKAGLETTLDRASGGLTHAGSGADVFNNVLLRYSDRYVEGDIRTGFTAVDTHTGAMRRGNLVVVGARPSTGKSEFAFHILRHGLSSGLNCALFSAEMSEEEIALRWVANEIGISVLEAQKLSDQERRELESQVVDALGKFQESGLILTDSPTLTSDDVRAQALSYKRSGRNLDLVVVDYLQLLKDPRERGMSGADRIGRMTGTLKQLARETQSVVIALSQLSRPDRSGKRIPEPTMEDLRGSGDIEQDADKVLLLHSIDYAMRRGIDGYRPGQRYFNADAKNVLFVNVAKNRMGPAWLTKVFYDPDRSMMRDLYENAPQGVIRDYNS